MPYPKQQISPELELRTAEIATAELLQQNRLTDRLFAGLMVGSLYCRLSMQTTRCTRPNAEEYRTLSG